MNNIFRSFSAILIACFSLLSFSLNSAASLSYVGDKVAVKVADRLEGETLGMLLVTEVAKDSSKLASISNHQSWLPSAMQGISANQSKMIILSLGMNDLNLPAHEFPSDAQLDKSIAAILDSLTTHATVYWIMPHYHIATKLAHHPAQRERVIKAIQRAKRRKNYPGLFLVDVDVWANFYGHDMTALLQPNKIYLTKSGADTAAKQIFVFGELIASWRK
jgi:hypothetical protein